MVHQCMPPKTGNLLPTIEISLPGNTFSLLQAVANTASEIGTPLYLVGGSVRDMLMRVSVKDMDLVVEGDATLLASEVSQKFSAAVLSHRRFGTATIKLEGQRFDLATARQESYARDGALPTVSPSTIHADLRRRDFTVNAMAVALSGPEMGCLLDPWCGESDLRMGVIRVLHPRSFVDDATRILRAIRYEQRLGFRLHEETHDLMATAIQGRMLSTVGGDRVRRELELMFGEREPQLSLQRCGQLNILRAIYPPLENGPSVQKLAGHKYAGAPLAYLAALAYPLTSEDAEGFIRSLRMPSRWARVVRDTVAIKQKWGDGHRMRPLIGDSGLPLGDMCDFLDGLTTTSVQTNAALSNHAELRDVLDLYLTKLRHMKPLLNGSDLIDLGVCEGPMVGTVLRELRIARLEGRTQTRDDESRLAQQSVTKGRQTLDGA